jgi:large conductance mechanosensitive channel
VFRPFADADHPEGALVIQGFKTFIMRGNVVDLAVAFVIGAAFTGVVTSFTNNIINPLIAAIGGTNVNGLAWKIVGDNDKTVMDFGAVITSIINFLIVAAVVYFLVVTPMNLLAERRRRGEEPPPETPSEEVQLLTEIRDALVGGAATPNQRVARDEAMPQRVEGSATDR